MNKFKKLLILILYFIFTLSSDLFAVNEFEQDLGSDGSEENLLDLVPDEVLLGITSFMNPKDLGRFAQTCRRAEIIVEDIRRNQPYWDEEEHDVTIKNVVEFQDVPLILDIIGDDCNLALFALCYAAELGMVDLIKKMLSCHHIIELLNEWHFEIIFGAALEANNVNVCNCLILHKNIRKKFYGDSDYAVFLSKLSGGNIGAIKGIFKERQEYLAGKMNDNLFWVIFRRRFKVIRSFLSSEYVCQMFFSYSSCVRAIQSLLFAAWKIGCFDIARYIIAHNSFKVFQLRFGSHDACIMFLIAIKHGDFESLQLLLSNQILCNKLDAALTCYIFLNAIEQGDFEKLQLLLSSRILCGELRESDAQDLYNKAPVEAKKLMLKNPKIRKLIKKTKEIKKSKKIKRAKKIKKTKEKDHSCKASLHEYPERYVEPQERQACYSSFILRFLDWIKG